MNKLEDKVRANKITLDEKLTKVNDTSTALADEIKPGFSDGWNNGWSNHGGPAHKGTGAKETVYGFSKGWDKGWGNYGGPPFEGPTLINNP